MSTTSEAVVIGRRFQKVSSYHFSHQIKCVAPLGTEAVAVHCTEGSEHVTSVYPLTPHSNSQRKSAIERTVQRFLYVRKYRVYVMFCGDLSLRVFSDTFQHMQTIPTTSTALCMEFVEATSTLYIGQSGYIKAWHLGNQLYCPLEPESQSTVAVGKDEWVVGLDYELDTSRLAAATENRVVIIDTKVHQEIATYHTGKCRDSITGAVLFSPLGYLVLAFRNGLIEVVNIALNSEVGELAGHIKSVTALKRHVTGSSLISCSLDGTVRVWSLETLVECNRLDLGVELLGLSVSGCGGGDNVQLLVHSHQDISIWHLSQLETHFASVYSNTVALSRVESPDAARIMATAGDGSVRLISPATGEVITTFFPIFTADLLSEMVYCPLCGLLFALLSTGEVLVASALTNPCSTLQLWTSTHREKIETISTCMVEWKGKRQSLVFGGSVCGHILLLHSSLFTMEPPCPAHGGRVCKLISSASPVKLAAPYNSSTPHLLSLGSDNFLNSWSIRVNRKGDHVVLKMLTCIQMESVPAHVSLLDTLLCVATTRNTVEMVDLSPELMGGHQNPYLPQGLLFHSLPVMSHQREDRHSAAITSLSCCPQLRLFATTSLDGLLKVWSPSNSMVAEIDFGERLFTACFSNSRGDLLVGFQRQLCSVAASHYLPSSHLSLGHSPSCLLEEPIPFDPSLQFW
jgi:WD40 repeat protein